MKKEKFWQPDIDINDGLGLIDADKNVVCRFVTMPELENFRLMATAPMMLDLIEDLLESFCPKDEWEGTRIRKKADLVLELAKGWEA